MIENVISPLLLAGGVGLVAYALFSWLFPRDS
jgi:hypothetical protein